MEKRYDHIKYEAKAKQQWETKQTYNMKNNPGPVYTIDTPPPTVSGKLHIGHIFFVYTSRYYCALQTHEWFFCVLSVWL